MTRGHFKAFTIIVFLLAAGIIGALVFLPVDLFAPKDEEIQRTKVVIPQTVGVGGEAQQIFQNNELLNLRISLEEDEVAITVLTRDFNGNSFEDQIIAYHKLQDIDSPIYITYAEYDQDRQIYSRKWNASTAATKPGTLILYSEDLIGDNGICILVSGMNATGEQTLTVFRKVSIEAEPFSKIAELLIEGSIAVEELDRGRRNPGRSLSISTYGRDYSSDNIMDQIEVNYTFNQVNGLYEQSRVVKIPGTQIEQRRVGELLNGDPGQFESFINGLWYQPLAKDSGEISSRKYVYFNTGTRELIFYDNNSQEIFTWQNSTSTRMGIHINSRNVSLTSLRRTINVELISLESIRLRVYQDAYLRSNLNTIWDGSYKRLPAAGISRETKKIVPYLEGQFTSHEGTITFDLNGSYRIDPLSGPNEPSSGGQYVFFSLGDEQLLELRAVSEPEKSRKTYKYSLNEGTLTLTQVRVSTRGIQDLYEAPIVLQEKTQEANFIR